MTWSPEFQLSLERFKEAVQKAEAKLDGISPDVRNRLRARYEEFIKRSTSSEILQTIYMDQALAPRQPVHSWDLPLRPGERGDSR